MTRIPRNFPLFFNYTFVRILQVVIFILFSVTCYQLSGQAVKKIKVKRSPKTFIFYQKGTKSDTIVKSKSDLFYLLLGDTMKEHVSIFIDNGQLIKTDNDSLFRLVYISGMSYECSYKKEMQYRSEKEEPLVTYNFKSMVNGVSSWPKGQINIVFRMENMVKPLLGNVFYYKD